MFESFEPTLTSYSLVQYLIIYIIVGCSPLSSLSLLISGLPAGDLPEHWED